MITAMNELLLFWSLVLLIAGALVLVREIYHDEPYGRLGRREPPRSHERDPFERTGSSWR